MVVAKLRHLDPRRRNGKIRWYFRHPAVGRTRIYGEPGEAVFQTVYARLLSQVDRTTKLTKELADSHSISWLVDQYKTSKWWQQLADKTRKDYARELDRLCAMAGDLPYGRLTSSGVRDMRDRVMDDVAAQRAVAIRARAVQDAAADAKYAERVALAIAAGKPPPPRSEPKRAPPKPTNGARTADLFKATLSAMITWAVEAGHMSGNPAERIRKLNRKRNTNPRVPWTEHQIEHVLRHAPRPIRDGVILGLYTGQRLGDCCRMTKGQCVGPIVRIRQAKTSNPIDVRATGPLVALIARRKGSNAENDAATLLVRDDGSAYSERLFSEHLRDYLDDQGWTDISFHGLRYAAAGTLNEAGATVATITSIIGHSTYQMALKYLASREDQARAAVLMEEAAARREA